MKRACVSVFIAAALVAAAASAQDKPEPEKPAPAKPEPVKARLVGVEELELAAGGKVEVGDDGVLHVFAGQRATNFYLLVKVKREVAADAPSPLDDLKVTLIFGTTRPISPYAVAVEKKELTEDGASYSVADKKRWVNETYYFGVVRGQREWDVMLNDKAAGKVLDYYATLVIRNVDEVSSRVSLPDGTKQIVSSYRQVPYWFPKGSYNLSLEIKGHGTLSLPWTKYDGGDLMVVAVVSDVRNAPAIPTEKLKKALPKINFAWRKYSTQSGVGGGAYNIGSADNPVHVYIDFGSGGAPGPIRLCEVDGIQVEFGTVTTSGKRGRSVTKPRVLRYAERDNAQWKVQPWEKQEYVYMPDDADTVVGEVISGKFTVRSVEKKPSTWARDGLLSRGVLYDQELGYLEATTKKQGDVVVILATKTKEP